MRSFQDVLEIAKKDRVVVTRVHIPSKKMSIEGEFELPPFLKLEGDDQVFIASFIAVHGSIKEMERLFGISYPTVKARLKKITEQLKENGFLVQTDVESKESILEKVSRGEMSVDEAAKRLERCSQ